MTGRGQNAKGVWVCVGGVHLVLLPFTRRRVAVPRHRPRRVSRTAEGLSWREGQPGGWLPPIPAEGTPGDDLPWPSRWALSGQGSASEGSVHGWWGVRSVRVRSPNAGPAVPHNDFVWRTHHFDAADPLSVCGVCADSQRTVDYPALPHTSGQGWMAQTRCWCCMPVAGDGFSCRTLSRECCAAAAEAGGFPLPESGLVPHNSRLPRRWHSSCKGGVWGWDSEAL